MTKSQTRTLEKHIYVEQRCGAFRFTVAVTPFPRHTATFSTVEEGATWARRLRVDLLEKKTKPSVSPRSSWPANGPSELPVRQELGIHPEAILLSKILDNYMQEELQKLAGKQAEESRLRRLRQWFGHLTLGELNARFLKKWESERLSGRLGSGRNPDRGSKDAHAVKPLTKHQRYWRKKQAGKSTLVELETNLVYPVSTQTVRHEIVLLRRAVQAYFDVEELMRNHGIWLQTHYLMRMPLPAKAEPRDRRLSDDEVVAVISQLNSPCLKAAVLLALLTTLRCSEIIALRWEDVDFRRNVVRLKEPGYLEKTKTHERDVPLLPGAVKVLQDLGVDKYGPIFSLTANGLSQAWRRAADRADIYDARLHDCRREAISRLIETCKLGLHTVVVFSGHTDIATLQRHYVRLNPERIASELAEIPGAHAILPTI